MPKSTHLLIALPNPDTETLNNINVFFVFFLFFYFLSNGSAQIKQPVVVKQYFEGGLKMINLMAFAQAQKLTWFRRILQNERKWHLLIKKKVCGDRNYFMLWF